MSLAGHILLVAALAVGSVLCCAGQPEPGALLSELADSANLSVWQRSLGRLQATPRQAFTSADRSLLAALLAEPQALAYPGYIKLAGFLGDDATVLDALPAGATDAADVRLATGLARVRLGDEMRRRQSLDHLRGQAVNDEFVEVIAPQLVYTRQREVLDYLISLAMTPSPGCTPLDPEARGSVDCSYRILGALSPAIEDLPYPVDEFGFAGEDPVAALAEARAWLRANADDYLINDDTY